MRNKTSGTVQIVRSKMYQYVKEFVVPELSVDHKLLLRTKLGVRYVVCEMSWA